MQDIIKMLDVNLIVSEYEIIDRDLTIFINSNKSENKCPHCGMISKRVNHRYVRKIQDLPIQNKIVTLMLTVRRFRCENKNCETNIFSEEFGFIEINARKTKR